MLLWQHECTWVYSHRMVSEVDVRRYRQAFVTAVKKDFTNDDEVKALYENNGAFNLIRYTDFCIINHFACIQEYSIVDCKVV